MLEKAVEVLKGLEADKGAEVSCKTMGKIEKRPQIEISKIEQPSYVEGKLDANISE
jgi:hypothetical protein